MRTIKFRFWDLEELRFRYGIQSHLYMCLLGYSDTTRLVNGGPKTMIPQQFTGILDINNKEIYEGDIVTAGILTDQVVWSGTSFNLNDWELGFAHHLLAGNIKVIGNIFENSELLKPTTK